MVRILASTSTAAANSSHRRPAIGVRRLSFAAEEFSSDKNAYEVLEVAEGSSAAEIKASFRRLAKETHPDVSSSSGAGAGVGSHRFLDIVAAYEILSNSQRRAHYDNYLFARRKMLRKKPQPGPVVHMYRSSITIKNQSEVVEWLKYYRLVVDDILAERKVAEGSGYFGELESELYSAIRSAYYGPLIESMDLLPECFEAEERSTCETSEVLHLVSGRDLFGIVYIVDQVPKLPGICCEKLPTFDSGLSHCVRQMAGENSTCSEIEDNHEKQSKQQHNFVSDVYKDLELHISGRVVATATRSPPKCNTNGLAEASNEDHIRVFLNLDEDEPYSTETLRPGSFSPRSLGSQIFLGSVTGLRTSAEEGICSVYDSSGTKTHVIMKLRTMMVKHMHWYEVGDKVSSCECRCTRARLPPSRFWLFEPRCSMHDIGGWYIETFGRDRKGRTTPSQRQWDSMMAHHKKQLHPAMYLLALAYRTLDLEDAKRRKQTVKDIVAPKLYSILRWCKKR